MVRTKTNLWLGIDVGTSGLKAILVNEKAKIIADTLIEYPMNIPKPGWAEQEPNLWWKALLKALALLRKKVPDSKERVCGIGLTGQMHSSVFLDKELNVIRPAILWCDQRTGRECDEITEKLGFDELVKLTLNRALTGFTLPKLLWLKNREPRNYRNLKKLLVCKDYIRLRLTGELATDVSDASGTLMFDVKNRRWSNELVEKLDIDPQILPRCYESTEITGYLSKKSAELLGLKQGIPVVAGGGDQPAGAVGNGIVEEGLLLISIGTSGVVFSAHNKPLFDKKARLHSFCHSVPGLWHSMGVMLSAGGSFRWLRELARELAPKIDYTKMTKLAKKIPPGSEGLFFLPYMTGERTPHFDPYARGVFFGLSLSHTFGHLVRAVIEGVSFALRDSVEIMRERGIKIEKIYLTGGGAKSKFWTQTMADVLGEPLLRLEVDEGPAYGSALLCMVGTGKFKSVKDAVKECLKLKDEFKPCPQRVSEYEKRYRIFSSLYPCFKQSFKKLS